MPWPFTARRHCTGVCLFRLMYPLAPRLPGVLFSVHCRRHGCHHRQAAAAAMCRRCACARVLSSHRSHPLPTLPLPSSLACLSRVCAPASARRCVGAPATCARSHGTRQRHADRHEHHGGHRALRAPQRWVVRPHTSTKTTGDPPLCCLSHAFIRRERGSKLNNGACGGPAGFAHFIMGTTYLKKSGANKIKLEGG